MRKEFFKVLYEVMGKNNDIYALTGDLGFGGFDKIQRDYPDRFINTGAAEQTLLDIAIGLAYNKKIPFCYSITPFLIYRGFESIRTYINHENLPVKLIGSGRDTDYKHDGFSHNATGIAGILDHFENIEQFYPKDKADVKMIVQRTIKNNLPTFISLSRKL